MEFRWNRRQNLWTVNEGRKGSWNALNRNAKFVFTSFVPIPFLFETSPRENYSYSRSKRPTTETPTYPSRRTIYFLYFPDRKETMYNTSVRRCVYVFMSVCMYVVYVCVYTRFLSWKKSIEESTRTFRPRILFDRFVIVNVTYRPVVRVAKPSIFARQNVVSSIFRSLACTR